MSAAVELRSVTKRFGTVLANDDVSLSVAPGEIHSIVGENGAGKSTLMGVLSGFVRPDSGEVWVDGELVPTGSPRASLSRGIGLCAQHFYQVPTLTGMDNIVLGSPRRAPPGGAAGDGPNAAAPRNPQARVHRLMERYGLRTRLDLPVEDLSIGEQERIEIVKLLYRDARILILDEPTAVLAPSEVEQLFEVLRSLAAEGRSILFVSHKLPEVLALSDHISVLRGGRMVGTMARADFDPERLVSLIVGGDPPAEVAWKPREPGETVLSLQGLCAESESASVEDVDLDVRAGEIVGVGGVEGNGQRELVHALLGYLPLRSGRIEFRGAAVDPEREGGFRKQIAVIPEDRHNEGLLLSRDLVSNAGLGKHDEAPFSIRGRVSWSRLAEHARNVVEEYGVRPPHLDAPAQRFSGGNQQRFIVGRELLRGSPFLLAVHPTRGVDLTAIRFIHRRLLEERERGTAILLVTADLTELRALCDRILVFYRGRIAYDSPRDRVDPDRLHRALLGLHAGAEVS